MISKGLHRSGAARIWRWGTQGVWGTEVPSGVQGQSPWWVVRGGIASRKLMAVIKDIWLPNHAQFCVFSSTGKKTAKIVRGISSILKTLLEHDGAGGV